MSWNTFIWFLNFTSYVLGTVIVLSGFRDYFEHGSKTALYISLAIIIVGPLEDLLNYILSGGSLSEKEVKELVDLVTSIAFLLLLGKVLQEA